MKRFLYTLLLTLVFVVSIKAQQVPGAVQSEAITISGATAHIGNGQVLENAIIIYRMMIQSQIDQYYNIFVAKNH